MSEATGPAMPNLGSSLVPQQNPETVVIGPTPPMNDSQRMELERYMKRDAIFLSTFELQRQRQNALMNEKQLEIRQAAQAGIEIFGPGYSPSYGNGSGIPLINGVPANNAFRIIYPAQRRRARKSKEFTFTRTMVEEQAQKEDVLVPIRLDIELDGLVLRDTFTWNLYESHITPEHFAEVLCEDIQFPVHQFAPHVAKAIRDQIQDYHLPALSVEEPLLEDQDQVPAIEEAKSAQELRILIKIDITVANTSLIDQFEWDISCPNNDPEHFAEVLAAELGLGGEFRTAIAHSIREQVQTHTKCLNLIGYNYDGSTVHDEDLKSSFLPKITTILREEDAVEQFTPILEKLTEPEIDKLERDRERDKRRKRRQTRGRRGVILPDLEPSKTRRTLMYHGQTLEPTDPQLDLQHSDLTMSNRLGPTTRRATMAHDHSPVGSQVTSAFSLAGQRTPLQHRMTRKLRGSGSDLSVHHVGFAGPGNSASASASSYSRDSLHGPKDKHIVGSREQHAYSPMRETTPVQNSKEGLAHASPMEPRTPQQMGRQGFATTPEPNAAFSPPPPGSGLNRRTTTSTSTVGTPVQTTFVAAEVIKTYENDEHIKNRTNLPKSLVQDQARLHQLYPSDRFEILVRANGVSGEVSTSMDDYRVRCLECPPGKLYNSGPEGTLQNFEVHLKSNRAHRSYVEQKKQRAGGTMPSYSVTPHAALQQSSQHPMPSSPLNPQQQNQQHHMAHHQQPQRMNGVGLGIEG
ncbi:SWI/SNF chromatin-remodeling complex subunit [Haplosporangium sp. Z 767]|nr:SWI/SNF chromatin-remodeling complex subunit [Haplosporangium sp. Z 767]